VRCPTTVLPAKLRVEQVQARPGVPKNTIARRTLKLKLRA